MRKASLFVGAALTAASLALAAPAMASPAPTVGLSDAVSTAAGAPGALAISAPKSAISVHDGGKYGARVGASTAHRMPTVWQCAISNRCSAGSKKASVLPLPVRAMQIT